MKKYISIFMMILFPLVFCAQIGDQIKISRSEIQFLENQEYVEISLPNSSITDEIGYPKIPYLRRMYVLPVDAEVTGIRVNYKEKHKISGFYNLYPIQPEIPSNLYSEKPSFIKNDSVYSTNAFFPGGNIVRVLSDGYESGYHIITLGVFPIEYNPVSKEVDFYSTINFTIEYTIGNQVNLLKNTNIKQSLHDKGIVNRHIKSIVQNKEYVDSYSPKYSVRLQSKNIYPIQDQKLRLLSKSEEIVPEYIIITCDSLKSSFQRLADWKTRKGVPTIIKTVEEISPNYLGSDIPERIRNYIIESTNRWGEIFVLLGGDYSIIPSKEFRSVGYPKKQVVVDLYYATVDGNWDENNPGQYIDYSVSSIQGRAPVDNNKEADIFISKVIGYEKGQVPNHNYYNNMLICDAFMYPDYPPYNDHGKYTLKNWINYPDNLNKWFIFDDSECIENKKQYTYTPPSLIDWNRGLCVLGDEELNKKNVISALNNEGKFTNGYFHIVYSMDHGHSMAHGTSSKDKAEDMTNANISALTNGAYQQIFVTGSCETAQFDKECFAEAYLNNPNGGGVAYIGNSDNGYVSEIWQFKLFMDTLYNKTSNPNSIGQIFRNIQKNRKKSNAKDQFDYFLGGNRKMVLLGDPEMQVWTATPKILSVSNVTVDTTATKGKSKVVFTIGGLATGDIATLCIKKGNEAYWVGKYVNGTDSVIIDSYSTDSIYLTATAHNYIPKELALASPRQNINVSISKLIFDDDRIEGGAGGNGDKQLDAGETIKLSVVLKNTGTNSVGNVSASLSCASPYINILTPSASFGNISSNDSAKSVNYFVFKINPTAPEVSINDLLHTITFNLAITDAAGNTYYDKFNIPISVSKLRQGHQAIVGNLTKGNTVDLYIDLFNGSQAEATGLQATLKSNNPYIASIPISVRNYPNIKFLEKERNLYPFRFTLSGTPVAGAKFDMSMEVKNEYGKIDTLVFDLLDRPTGSINSLKGKGAEHEIKVEWQYSGSVAGYNVYRCDSLNGSYKKINNFLVPHTYFIDYNLTPLTKYDYKVTAVSKSGNETPLSSTLETWTILPRKNGFPVIMNLNAVDPRCVPLSIYDVDNDGKKEIIAGLSDKDGSTQGFLIGLRSDGTELFDIDNNTTTNSGFAYLGAAIKTNVGIGDFFGIGENQIVSATRKHNNGGNNYIAMHSVFDTKPDDKESKPDLIWKNSVSIEENYMKAPVISNWDNSSDGSLEIILHPDRLNNIYIRDNNGLLVWSDEFKDGWNSSGAITVGDIDNDGYKDIFLGTDMGVYRWYHDADDPGNYRRELFYENNNPNIFTFCSSSVICDLDNDGTKELLIRRTNKVEKFNEIFVLKSDSLASGWGTQRLAGTSEEYQDISVGDLNNDGFLEVVAVGLDTVKVWNKDGTLILSRRIPDVAFGIAPILADIDGGEDVEILVGAEDRIECIKIDGSNANGFPINTEEGFPRMPHIAVADLDNDGKSDLIAHGTFKIHAWSTNGNADKIEWGCIRGNPQNTGEYGKVCEPTIIRENTQWSNVSNICGNIIVESGNALTLTNSDLTHSDEAMIIVKNGGNLVIDGGKINNANIKALPGSNVIIKNNGYVKLRTSGAFDIQQGATLDHQTGVIDKQ